jgi:hypothetical protein
MSAHAHSVYAAEGMEVSSFRRLKGCSTRFSRVRERERDWADGVGESGVVRVGWVAIRIQKVIRSDQIIP